MPDFIVTYKEDCTEEDKERLRESIKAQNGEITQEYTLIPAFAVKYPEGTIHTLDSDPKVERVEVDAVMTTQ